MSCPDWKGLTAWRRERDGDEPAGYREALAHLDGGCALCRRQALAADPMLMFRAVPVIEIPEAQEVDEVEAMRQAVAAMRTASRMEALETRRTRHGWWKWASAAMLAVAALSVSTDGRFRQDPAALQAGEFRRMDFDESDRAGSFGFPDTMPAAYTAGLVDAGDDSGPSAVRQHQMELGGGMRPVEVLIDETMPEGFFGDT